MCDEKAKIEKLEKEVEKWKSIYYECRTDLLEIARQRDEARRKYNDLLDFIMAADLKLDEELIVKLASRMR